MQASKQGAAAAGLRARKRRAAAGSDSSASSVVAQQVTSRAHNCHAGVSCAAAACHNEGAVAETRSPFPTQDAVVPMTLEAHVESFHRALPALISLASLLARLAQTAVNELGQIGRAHV